jgi:glycosyltransferase involved in cell wall biosynthesis
VEAIGIAKNGELPFRVIALRRQLKDLQTNLLQTWLYHADLAGILFGKQPVVWNVQNSTLDRHSSPWTTRMIRRVCTQQSGKAAAIIYCAENARLVHEKIGYQNPKSVVIENGIDLAVFQPNPEIAVEIRQQLQIPGDSVLVGHAGRYDQQKDYPTLLKAFGYLAKARKDIHFVLCGRGLTDENPSLTQMVNQNALGGRIRFLGLQEHMEKIFPGFDVFLLASAYGEGFPNVLGEAMACGVPCVSTDVGDSRRLIGESGAVVPIGDAERMTDEVLTFLSEDAAARKARSAAARARIAENFSIQATLQKYQHLYASLR